ncbi:sugar phosphate exchanger 3-like [Ciona intestinalis]
MLTSHHVAVFILTFFCYVWFHATRKTFSNIKDDISKEWTPTPCNLTWPCPSPNKTWSSHNLFESYDDAKPFLGLLDTVFMFCYAVGLYFSGIIGDRFELRKVLAIGMWLSGILVFTFGTLTQWVHFYNKAFYIIIWGLNGLAQSCGWPSVVAVMGNWFGKSSRGLIFGVWSSCASVGNIIGTLLASQVIDYGYEQAFLVTSVPLFCTGFIVFFGLVSSPTEIGLSDPNKIEPEIKPDESVASIREIISDDEPLVVGSNPSVNEENCDKNENETKPIGFFRAILLPGVIPYSLAYGCLKLVNYAFFFWLPYYLTNNFKWDDSKADDVSTWYDVGGIIGGIVFGVITDRFENRAPVLVGMLVVAPFTVWGYERSPNNVAINSVLMSLIGIFVGGASNIISSAVTAELGKQPAVGQNVDALATVTGILDGTSSIFAAVGQYLVAVIQTHLGWDWVFYSFIIMIILSLVCLIPMITNDVKTLWTWLKTRLTSS